MTDEKQQKKAGAAAAGKGTGVKPRPYVVFRDYTVDELVKLAQASKIKGDAVVKVELGTAEAVTPKAARVEVAKTKVEKDELKTDDPEKGGVELHAVTKSALDGGRAPVRLVVREDFS